MRFVPLKTVESQDIQAIHRLRSRLIKERTALVNQVRGLLAERGIVIAQGITRLRKQFPTIVEDLDNELTPLSREVMRELYDQLAALDERIAHADRMVQRVFTENAQCQKLARVEGIGPVPPRGRLLLLLQFPRLFSRPLSLASEARPSAVPFSLRVT